MLTLDEFIIQRQKDFPFATGDLSGILRNISLAAKVVNREVNKAGLVNILGETGSENVQGEKVKILDEYANDQFINSLKISGLCCGIGSEENDEFIAFEDRPNHEASYVVCMDPLDGSSNIDVNVSIGTIFSIYKRKSPLGPCNDEDFLQPGSEQVAAGYVIYGSSTMMVYTTKNGLNGFTLDPSIGEFCLSHPNIQIPKTGKYYSINQGYMTKFEKGVREFVKYCQEHDPETNRPFGLRYIGSMVADVHRNLINGGIFVYPALSTHPNGKLRLVYECNPMSLIVEQAGGKATNGYVNILDLKPKKLHERSPIFIGSTALVEAAEKFLLEYADHEPKFNEKEVEV